MATSNRFIAQAVATLTLLTATSLQAGEITGFSWFSGVASVASTTILPPVAPNNNNVAGVSPNEVFITQKDYRAIGPVDIVFPVTASGGVTEYSFVEGVYNGTGLNWTGYHIELGFNIGPLFTKSLPGDGLDFDAPEFDSRSASTPRQASSRLLLRAQTIYWPAAATCPPSALRATFASASTCPMALRHSPFDNPR